MSVKDKILEAISEKTKIRLLIQLDENVGYYLFVYKDNSKIAIEDYLCDSLEEAFIEAKERYGIQKEDFIQKINQK